MLNALVDFLSRSLGGSQQKRGHDMGQIWDAPAIRILVLGQMLMPESVVCGHSGLMSF